MTLPFNCESYGVGFHYFFYSKQKNIQTMLMAFLTDYTGFVKVANKLCVCACVWREIELPFVALC